MSEHDFDPAVATWLAEGPDRGPRERLERILIETRAVGQRPGWTFVGRWLPTTWAMPRSGQRGGGWLLVLAILLAIAAMASIVLVGSLLTRPIAVPLRPAANGVVAFEGDGGLEVGPLDGGPRLNLSGSVPRASAPRFSPDGTLVAFVSRTSDNDFGGRLFVVPTDGSAAPTEVGGEFDVQSAYHPALAWSPDDTRIAFATSGPAVTAIAVAYADGSGATLISDHSAIRDRPAWSPDGSLIAYRIVQLDKSSRSIAVAHSDGSGERILSTVGRDLAMSGPQWSPDGTKLGFHRDTPNGGQAVIIDLEGRESLPWPGQAGATEYRGVAWSPDGRSLALITENGVTVVGTDGTNPRHFGDLAYCWLEWSPDGAYVFGPQGDHCSNNIAVIPIANPALRTDEHTGMGGWQPLRVVP